MIIKRDHLKGVVGLRLILGFEDMLPVAIKFPGVTPARLDRAA